MPDFIGQSSVIRELNFLIPRATEGENYNILFSARTGYGKTFLALKVVSRVAPYHMFLTEDANEIVQRIRERTTRVNIVDEVQLLRNIELLYPIMDAGRHLLLFTTNQGYDLPEAFKRRCIPMLFGKYNKTELAKIAADRFPDVELSKQCLDRIVSSSNYTPGNIVLLCIRLQAVFGGRRGFTVAELDDALINIFNIRNGLDVRCQEYMEILQRLGHASLDVLAYSMGVNKDTITTEVENVLLARNLIRITSKGRSLTNDENN